MQIDWSSGVEFGEAVSQSVQQKLEWVRETAFSCPEKLSAPSMVPAYACNLATNMTTRCSKLVAYLPEQESMTHVAGSYALTLRQCKQLTLAQPRCGQARALLFRSLRTSARVQAHALTIIKLHRPTQPPAHANSACIKPRKLSRFYYLSHSALGCYRIISNCVL